MNEKQTAKKLGIPTAPYWKITSSAELSSALEILNAKAILKTAKLGYDGKGQIRTRSGENADHLWKEINTELAILESFVDFKKDYKNGFSMMASACLLIETYMAFQYGAKSTKGKGKKYSPSQIPTHCTPSCVHSTCSATC